MTNKPMLSVEREHRLKIHRKPFLDLESGAKTCEIRDCSDRDFQIGDIVLLMLVDETGNPTANELCRKITHIQTGYGLPDDLCVLSYEPAAQHQGERVTAKVCGYTPGMGLVELRVTGGIPSWLELGEVVTVVAGDSHTPKHQGEPVVKSKPVAKLHAERLTGRDGEYGVTVEDSEWFNTCRLTGGIFNLYAEQAAPVVTVAKLTQAVHDVAGFPGVTGYQLRELADRLNGRKP